MRRSVWILAMCGFAGLSLQEVRAQEAFGQANPFESAKPARSIFFTARDPAAAATPPTAATPAAPATAAPSRFVRSTETAAPAGDPKNFYSELFGTPEGSSPPAMAPTAPGAAGSVSLSDVSPATFEVQSGQSGTGTVQQVRNEQPSLGNARPFPRREAEARPVPVAGRDNRLTTPIQTEAAPTAFAPTPPGENTGRGTLTISRGTPAAASSARFVEARSVAGSSTAGNPVATTTAAAESQGPQTPTVSVEWVKQSDINVGQKCRCDLVVRNPGKTAATNLEVEAFFPKNIRLISATPEPAAGASSLIWTFVELAPGEARTLEVTFIPLERGAIETRADVRFSATANGSFTVAEPLLAIKIEGPQEVLVGEPASHTVHVSNPGTGIAANVQIEALIPEGLEHARGKRLLMDLGSLNPGETRPVRLALAATTGGTQVLQVQVRAEGGLVQTSSAEIVIIAPKIVAGIDGPGLRYVGRPGVYTLSVVNDGAAATDNVRVMHKVPEGQSFVSADRGAQYDPSTRLLSWFVGRLDAGQAAQIKVTLDSDKIGEFTHFVRATSEHGSLSNAEFTTAVEGTSSLAIEVRDLDDPVEVGSEAIYEVRVRNEGSAPAKNIGLACELAPGMTFIAAEGPSEHIAENGVVMFRSQAELGPGQVLTYKVHVSAGTAASLRFRARLSSDSIAEPLTSEELTKFYGE